MNDGSTKSETPSVRPIEQRGEVVYKLTLGLRIFVPNFSNCSNQIQSRQISWLYERPFLIYSR